MLLTGTHFFLLDIVVKHLAFSSNLPKMLIDFKALLLCIFDENVFGKRTSFIRLKIRQGSDYVSWGKDDTSNILRSMEWTLVTLWHFQCPSKFIFFQPSMTKYSLGVSITHYTRGEFVSCFIWQYVLFGIFFAICALARNVHAPRKQNQRLLLLAHSYASGTKNLKLIW